MKTVAVCCLFLSLTPVSHAEETPVLEISRGLETTPLIAVPLSGEAQRTVGSLEVSISQRDLRGLMEWNIILKNTGSEDLRLQPRLTWKLPAEAGFTRWWGGGESDRAISQLTEGASLENLRTMAPWTAVYDESKGRALGLDPGQLLSFVKSSYAPVSESAPEASLSLATRLVVRAGGTEKVRFWTAQYETPFDPQRVLVQRVHDSYPQYFRPDPNVLPSIWGASAQYWMSGLDAHTMPGAAPLEMMRRLYATWEWSYAPFKRAGDHLVRKELWDYKPLLGFDKRKSNILAGGPMSFDGLSREEFLKRREAYFNRHGGGFGFMFYTPLGAWMERQLAEEKHADALITDPNHKHDLKYYVTGYDQERLVMPWFTSVQSTLEEDFRELARTLDIHGFGLDVALGGPRYRGPGVRQEVVPVAYDEEGDFLDLGVGAAKLMDYIHTLPVRFSPENHLAVVLNGTRSCNTALRGDLGMLEGTPYYHGHEMIGISRYLFGQKPLTWWKGWAYAQIAVPNWQQYDQAHFIRTMKGLVDYALFSSFEWGTLPTVPYELGVPKLVRYMPLLIDSSRRGWEALFPVRFAFEGQVHTGRYGQGTQTRLFWGNPYEDGRRIEAEVDHSYLSDGAVVFASAANGPSVLKNVFVGHVSRLAFDLPSRQPLLLDAVAVLPRGRVEEVSASLESSLYGKTITLRGSQKTQEELPIRIPRFPGFRLLSVSMGDAEIPFESGEEEYLSRIPAMKEPFTFQAVYRSEFLNFKRAALDSFPFFDRKGNPGFGLRVQPPDALNSLGLDQRLRQYFSYYARVALGHEDPQPIALLAPGEGKGGPRLIVELDPRAGDAGSVSAEGDSFRLVARSPKELAATLDAFLRALDERFPYVPGFFATWGMDGRLLRHVDMSGKTLEDGP